MFEESMKKCIGECGRVLPLSEFPSYKLRSGKRSIRNKCQQCITEERRERLYRVGKSRPMSESRESSAFLGCYVAERALKDVFHNVKQMKYHNHGFDFVCGRGYKVDVKSSCICNEDDRVHSRWQFNIYKNTVADYFLCLAFDDRDSLNPLHLWLIPGEDVNYLVRLSISEGSKSLATFKKYELPRDNLEKSCLNLRMESKKKGDDESD